MPPSFHPHDPDRSEEPDRATRVATLVTGAVIALPVALCTGYVLSAALHASPTGQVAMGLFLATLVHLTRALFFTATRYPDPPTGPDRLTVHAPAVLACLAVLATGSATGLSPAVTVYLALAGYNLTASHRIRTFRPDLRLDRRVPAHPHDH